MRDSSDRITRRDGLVIVHGTTGVDYIVSTRDQLDENLRTCNVEADRDLLLDARSYLAAGVGSLSHEAPTRRQPQGIFCGTFQCGCGRTLRRFQRWNGLAHVNTFAAEDESGEYAIDSCPNCGQDAHESWRSHEAPEPENQT